MLPELHDLVQADGLSSSLSDWMEGLSPRSCSAPQSGPADGHAHEPAHGSLSGAPPPPYNPMGGRMPHGDSSSSSSLATAMRPSWHSAGSSQSPIVAQQLQQGPPASVQPGQQEVRGPVPGSCWLYPDAAMAPPPLAVASAAGPGAAPPGLMWPVGGASSSGRLGSARPGYGYGPAPSNFLYRVSTTSQPGAAAAGAAAAAAAGDTWVVPAQAAVHQTPAPCSSGGAAMKAPTAWWPGYAVPAQQAYAAAAPPGVLAPCSLGLPMSAWAGGPAAGVPQSSSCAGVCGRFDSSSSYSSMQAATGLKMPSGAAASAATAAAAKQASSDGTNRCGPTVKIERPAAAEPVKKAPQQSARIPTRQASAPARSTGAAAVAASVPTKVAKGGVSKASKRKMREAEDNREMEETRQQIKALAAKQEKLRAVVAQLQQSKDRAAAALVRLQSDYGSMSANNQQLRADNAALQEQIDRVKACHGIS